MTGPLLTLLNAPIAGRLYRGRVLGRRDALRRRRPACAVDAGRLRGARPPSPADLCGAGRGRRPAGGASWRAAALRPGQRVAVWLPSRVETAIALLACSRNGYVCCPSLHRDHTVGRGRRAGRPHARRRADRRSPATAPMPTGTTSSTELADRDFLRCAWRVGPADAAPFADLAGAALEPCRRAAIPTRSCICRSPPARPARRKASCTATTRCSPRRG